MSDQSELIQKLISVLAITEADELDCDQVFEALDVYIEAKLTGKDAAELYPLVERHLLICADCEEEYQALLRLLESTKPS